MPTYEYACPQGHEFELFQKMSDKPRAKCPVCGRAAVRKISGGAGLHFKGSGFYITDYGKDGKKPQTAPAAEGTSSGTDKDSKSASTPQTETKSGDSGVGKAAKPESVKPAEKSAPSGKSKKSE